MSEMYVQDNIVLQNFAIQSVRYLTVNNMYINIFSAPDIVAGAFAIYNSGSYFSEGVQVSNNISYVYVSHPTHLDADEIDTNVILLFGVMDSDTPFVTYNFENITFDGSSQL